MDPRAPGRRRAAQDRKRACPAAHGDHPRDRPYPRPRSPRPTGPGREARGRVGAHLRGVARGRSNPGARAIGRRREAAPRRGRAGRRGPRAAQGAGDEGRPDPLVRGRRRPGGAARGTRGAPDVVAAAALRGDVAGHRARAPPAAARRLRPVRPRADRRSVDRAGPPRPPRRRNGRRREGAVSGRRGGGPRGRREPVAARTGRCACSPLASTPSGWRGSSASGCSRSWTTSRRHATRPRSPRGSRDIRSSQSHA